MMTFSENNFSNFVRWIITRFIVAVFRYFTCLCYLKNRHNPGWSVRTLNQYSLAFFFLSLSLIKHENLFTNFARAKFECMLPFVSLLFISLLWLFLPAKGVYTEWLWTNKMKFIRNRSRLLWLSQNPHFYDDRYMQSTTMWQNNANILSSRK